jgi:hypothetical protein
MLLNCNKNTYDLLCAHCGVISAGIPIESILVSAEDLVLTCPHCLSQGIQSTEHHPHRHTAQLAATMALRAKESLVGTVMEGGNIVTSDTRFEIAAHTQEQVRHCLMLHKHPAVKVKRRAARQAAGMADPLPAVLATMPQETP